LGDLAFKPARRLVESAFRLLDFGVPLPHGDVTLARDFDHGSIVPGDVIPQHFNPAGPAVSFNSVVRWSDSRSELLFKRGGDFVFDVLGHDGFPHSSPSSKPARNASRSRSSSLNSVGISRRLLPAARAAMPAS